MRAVSAVSTWSRAGAVLLGVSAIATASCKSKEAPAPTDDPRPKKVASANSGAPSASTTTKRDPPRWGRCNPDGGSIPFLYVFPERGEFFHGMVMFSETSAMRFPMTIVKETPDRLDFTYKVKHPKAPSPVSESGSLARGAKWTLSGEMFGKTIECQPQAEEPIFYSNLVELGVRAGKWKASQAGDSLTIDESAQRWVRETDGKATVFYYRVLAKSAETGIKLLVDNLAPDAELNEAWRGVNLTLIGTKMIMSMGDIPADGWPGTFEPAP